MTHYSTNVNVYDVNWFTRFLIKVILFYSNSDFVIIMRIA